MASRSIALNPEKFISLIEEIINKKDPILQNEVILRTVGSIMQYFSFGKLKSMMLEKGLRKVMINGHIGNS